MFSNTNTWYKHVRDKHQEEYCRKCPDIPAPTVPTPEDQLGAEMDSRDGDQDEDITPLTLDTPLVDDAPTFVTQDVAAGLLLKLKERHRLSQAAIDEVVQIVGTVSDHMVIESLTAVRQCGEAHGMDMSSPFFQDLPGILENVSNPLATLGTAYRQQSYVKKNFPYVVSTKPVKPKYVN